MISFYMQKNTNNYVTSAENFNKRGMTPDTTLQFSNSFILVSR
jgi:hypothetical protein